MLKDRTLQQEGQSIIVQKTEHHNTKRREHCNVRSCTKRVLQDNAKERAPHCKKVLHNAKREIALQCKRQGKIQSTAT